jgi:hypothetical protein
MAVSYPKTPSGLRYENKNSIFYQEPKVRRFGYAATKDHAFYDGTQYLEVVGDKVTAVRKNGTRSDLIYTANQIDRLVRMGTWVELPVPAPGNEARAYVKIPGLHPKEPNALRLLTSAELDRLEERVKKARENIRVQEKMIADELETAAKKKQQAAIAETMAKPGTLLALKRQPSQKYVVMPMESAPAARQANGAAVALLRITNAVGMGIGTYNFAADLDDLQANYVKIEA